VISMRGLLDSTGFNLRVTATDALPGQGPLVPNAIDRTREIARLASVRSAVALRFANAVVLAGAPRGRYTSLRGVGASRPRPAAYSARPPHRARSRRDRRQRDHRHACAADARFTRHAACIV